MKTVEEVIQLILNREPNLGSADVSKCLPGWIKTFVEKYELGKGFDMSHNAVGALAHTLIAGKLRVERLILERDAALAELAKLKKDD